MKRLVLLISFAISIAGCVEDPDNVPFFGGDGLTHKYIIEFRGQSSLAVQYPVNIIYFKDDRNGDLTSEIVNSQTSAEIIETRELTSYGKLGFKLSIASGGQADVDTVIIKDVDANQIIFENHNLDIPAGKTFMYVISANSYTITN